MKLDLITKNFTYRNSITFIDRCGFKYEVFATEDHDLKFLSKRNEDLWFPKVLLKTRGGSIEEIIFDAGTQSYPTGDMSKLKCNVINDFLPNELEEWFIQALEIFVSKHSKELDTLLEWEIVLKHGEYDVGKA